MKNKYANLFNRIGDSVHSFQQFFKTLLEITESSSRNIHQTYQTICKWMNLFALKQ